MVSRMKASNLQGLKIVCLGGGVGTSNLLRGLKHYGPKFTVITSMADDGGSSGKLRKAYHIMPPGDVINTIAALIPDDQKELASLLLHRFPGKSKENKAIDGQKLGNLIMLAEVQRTGDFYKAIKVTQKIFGVDALFLPATDERTRLTAITPDGRRVHGETTLDLALYSEPHGIKKVYFTPKKPKVNPKVTEALMDADIIISGPVDLYTNQLAVLIVPEVREALIKSNAKKLFIGNIANKPFETKGFSLQDFINAIADHLGINPFDQIYVNNNYANPIPEQYDYTYVKIDEKIQKESQSFRLIEGDVVSDTFPIYHDFAKLASLINNNV
jgi:uncharacterized cofD-like protein